MLRLAFAFIFCVVICAASGADGYSWEVSGAGSSDSGSIVETDTWGATTTYHFGSVDDGNGPYALAAFYDPVTRVSAGVSREKQTVEIPQACFPSCALTRLESSTTKDDYTVGGRYVLPSSRWYFGGAYSQGSTDLPPSLYPASRKSKEYGVIIGKYLGPKTSLALSAQTSLDRIEATVVSCNGVFFSCYPSDSAVTDTTNDHVGLSAQHVRHFRGLTYSLTGRLVQTAGHLDVELHPLPSSTPVVPLPPIGGAIVNPLFNSYSLGRYREYAVGADLFPTTKIGIHVGYSTFDGRAPNDYAYGVGASWFVTRHVALQLGFDRVRPVFATPGDVDTSTLQVTGRF